MQQLSRVQMCAVSRVDEAIRWARASGGEVDRGRQGCVRIVWCTARTATTRTSYSSWPLQERRMSEKGMCKNSTRTQYPIALAGQACRLVESPRHSSRRLLVTLIRDLRVPRLVSARTHLVAVDEEACQHTPNLECSRKRKGQQRGPWTAARISHKVLIHRRSPQCARHI